MQPQENLQQDAVTRAVPEPRARQSASVGDQLRIARERRGEDVFAIADHLRIKPDFLSALERGAYDRLPADAYAVGFLRSYAEHLGLDSVALRAAYRQEVSGRARAPYLSMPQPLPEGKTPHLLLILGGILFALGIYTAWYFSIPHGTGVIAPPPAANQAPIQPTPEPTPAPAALSTAPISPPPMPAPPTPAIVPTPTAIITPDKPLIGTPSNGSPSAIPLATTPAQVETRTTLTPAIETPAEDTETPPNNDKTDQPAPTRRAQ